MVLTWTDEDKQTLSRSEVSIHQENIVPDKLDETNLPNDIHIVEYEMAGETYYDAVRAYKMVDIFDVYYDKMQGGGKVVRIKSGYGRIKPKFWKPEGEVKEKE